MWSVAVKTHVVHSFGMPERTDPQFKLRLPAELKKRLEDAAARANRSLTAEIVSRLESSFAPSPFPKDFQAELQRIVDRLDQQRYENEGARMRLYSEAFGRLYTQGVQQGLTYDEAWRAADKEARRISDPDQPL